MSLRQERILCGVILAICFALLGFTADPRELPNGSIQQEIHP